MSYQLSAISFQPSEEIKGSFYLAFFAPLSAFFAIPKKFDQKSIAKNAESSAEIAESVS